jgi:DNA-binding NarL/FixJ family response regulator
MSGARVYIIWSNPLFHESVRLLMSKSDVEIVGDSSDHDAARSQVAALEPDVVVIEQTDGEELNSEETISILRAGPRVIRLGLSDNEISLYQREHRTAARADDLVSLITGRPPRGNSEAESHDE